MLSLVDQAKKAAAYRAVDETFPAAPKVVGVGSGSTVIFAVERIGQLPNKDQFVCVPTGFQSKQLILSNGLRLGSIEEYPEIDIAYDGADEVDANMQLIKGGGACLFQEKLIALCAKQLVIVADERKISETGFLGNQWRQGVPVEIVPTAWRQVIGEMVKLGAKKVDLRQGGAAKAGPVVTDNCNFLLDVDFGEIEDPAELHRQIKLVVGVVETGIFVDMAYKVYFGLNDGSIKVQDKKA